jgi:hypothetical protein
MYGNNLILREFSKTLNGRLREPDPLIQVILGPRHVGKTTGVEQIIQDLLSQELPCHYASADAVFRSDWSWVERQWDTALGMGPHCVLVLDEIQKVENWSESVKKLWDQSRRMHRPLKVVLLGSSSLALQTGLSESLAGRFELIRVYHWNFPESREAFGYTLDDFLTFGGYPGADRYRQDPERWLAYVKTSIVETVLEKDITQHRRIERPALFKQVFELLCSYPGAEISHRKLVGQLQDPGSVATIQHYIELLEGAFLVKTLQKFSTSPLQKKASSPKILPLCPALCTFVRGEATLNSETWGRLFELAVGLDLLQLPGTLFYWRQDQWEVDFVYRQGAQVIGIEVKSGRKKSPHGLAKFRERFPGARTLMIEPDSYGEFAASPRGFIKL